MNHEDSLKTLLMASQPGRRRAKTGEKAKANIRNVDIRKGECINPYTADPEEWDCDCYPKMIAKCDYTKLERRAACIRDLMCQSPVVCDRWKRLECPAANAISRFSRSNQGG